jgi:hypothetical protein
VYQADAIRVGIIDIERNGFAVTVVHESEEIFTVVENDFRSAH